MEHCDIRTTLDRAGLSKTPQRMAVLRALVHADTPLSAKDILDRLGGGSRINKVTVYRTLSSLKAERIIREIATDHGVSFYEMACLHNPAHPHFYCRACRSLACLPAVEAHRKWLQGLRPSDAVVESVAVHVTGLCRKCLRTVRRGDP
ncbi:MAG: transcriptional repressor [Syntrophaceae bacterium]|nr:transcriptional repressor [Syntrophaceae bacterium]